MSKHVLLRLAPLCLLATACIEEYYSPEPYLKQLAKEEAMAHRNLPKLTAEGKLPSKEAEVIDPSLLGEQTFGTYCVTCHGQDGTAQTPAAQALNPKPRNFNDKTWQTKVTDEHIAKIIKDGGASVGLSASMAPWGSILKDEQIQALVIKIRKYGH